MGERYLSKRQKDYLYSNKNLNSLKKISSHLSWNKGLTKDTDERVKIIGNKIHLNTLVNENFGNRNKRFTKEHKEKISVSHIGKRLSEETKKKISLANKGKKFNSEINKKKGSKGELNPFYGKHHNNSTKEMIRKKAIEWWKIPENRKKILNDEMLKRRLKGLFKRPTSLERDMISVIKKYNLPYKYTGDGSFIVGYKNPDFVNVNGEKICIETRPKPMCEIWNKCSPEEYKKMQIEHYKKYGWKCIVIWQEDLEQNVVNDIIDKQFLGNTKSIKAIKKKS